MNANTLSIDVLFPNIKSIEDPLFIKSTDTTEYIIYVMGDSLVGKSSLCMRFALNEFNLEIKPSRTTECYVKRIKLFDKDIKVVLIDLHSFSREIIVHQPLEKQLPDICIGCERDFPKSLQISLHIYIHCHIRVIL